MPPTANAPPARPQQQHQAHREANPDLAAEYRAVVREDKWRRHAQARAVALERPTWSRELGERPATVKGGRTWDRAVEQTIEYRQRWNVEDVEHPLGREPHGLDASLAQRQTWRHATRAVDRLRDLAGDRTDRGERGDHREATGRGDRRDDHEATPRGDRRSERKGTIGLGTRMRPLDRERDPVHERAM